MTTHVLLNPAAATNVAVQRVLQQALTDGHDLAVAAPGTGAPAPADWARAAIDAGARRLVICGGDGTLHAALQGIMDRPSRPPITLVPAGTGNDLARGLGLPLAPAEVLAACLQSPGEPRPLDVVRLDDRWMANVLTVGLPARATEDTPRPLKDALGGLAYVAYGVTCLPRLQPMQVDIRWDDDGHWAGRALAVYAGSGPYAGAGFVVCPDADPGDGMLQLVIVPDQPVGDLAAMMAAAAVGRDPEGRQITARCEQVTIAVAGDEAPAANADGEPVSARRFSLQVVPGALRLM